MKTPSFLFKAITPIFLIVLTPAMLPAQTGVSSDGPSLENGAVSKESQSEIITLKIPLMSPIFSNTPVAVVNDEPIIVDELTRELTLMHKGAEAGDAPGKRSFARLLKRMITAKLIVLEARNIGLDELLEIRAEMDNFSNETLKSMLLKRHLDGLGLKADEAEVEELYREMSREYKLNSILFKTEEDSHKALGEINAGQDFNTVLKKYVEEGKAEGEEEGQFFGLEKLLPGIAAIVREMEVGSVSPVFRLSKNFTIVKLEDVRYPEDPGKKEQARQLVLKSIRKDAIYDYADKLTKKYSKINKSRLKRLDFDSEKPGIQKLLEDERVLVKIEGEEPITVADLARTMKKKFFHGIEKAAKKGEVNDKIDVVLKNMVYERVIRKESMNQGIDTSEDYKDAVRRHEEAQLFGAFVRKVITPEIRLEEAELREYYDEHSGDYSYPKMVKIDSLVFQDVDSAKSALGKLNRGTDFKWLSENAGGQVPRDTEGLLTFGDSFITITNLPEGVREVLSNAGQGDHRIFESSEGHFYVLNINELIPSKPRPFKETRKEIADIIFKRKVEESIEKWGEMLKKAYDTSIYVTDLD